MQNEYEYDPEVEELELEEVELFEDEPAVDQPQADEHGNQDVLEEGEALGDDLAPAEEKKGDDSNA